MHKTLFQKKKVSQVSEKHLYMASPLDWSGEYLHLCSLLFWIHLFYFLFLEHASGIKW